MSNQMTIKLAGGRKVDAHYDGHVMRTDGNGEAPCPFDFFLASIGTCAGYFIVRYCEARDIDTTGIESHEEWHRTDGKVSSIRLDVTVPDHISERHRKGIIQATEHCSVKKLMAAPPEIVCRLAEPVTA